MEALDAGKEFQKVLIQRDEKGERTTALVAQLRGLNIPVQRVPKEKLNRITVKNHQGIVAFLSPISYQPLEELIIDFVWFSWNNANYKSRSDR